MKPPYKIVIIDDHPVFCLGMKELINKDENLQVVASEESAKRACDVIRKVMPALVIVDISLKDGNGIDLIDAIRTDFGDLPILLLSMYDESLYAERAIRAGANGYITKREATSQIVKAIRSVLDGEIYVSSKIKDKVFRQFISRQQPEEVFAFDTLTNRELEVFRLIGEGLATKEIAETLHLSIKTIGTYREKIKEKLSLKHYTELVKVAVHWSKTQ